MPELFPVISELEHESAATARLLNALPATQLGWKPHPKSMTLGQLALHVATIPGGVAQVLSQPGVEAALLLDHQLSSDAAAIRESLPASIAAAKAFLSTQSPAGLAQSWSILHKGSAALTVPKAVAIRLLMLNHWYHHRGQLSVYLRLLDTPVPATYGASADDNPFA